MDFNFDLELIQSQKILLTPQLKQALDILKMSSQELCEYIEDQIEVNPALELPETEEILADVNVPPAAEDSDWSGYTSENLRVNSKDDENMEDIRSFTQDTSTMSLSLKQHLLFQLHTGTLQYDLIPIAEYLIDNIDENGYITTGIGDAASFFNIPSNKVEKVLKHLQTFDPPGICARSLKECLLIQLSQMEHIDIHAVKIIEHYLDELATNKVTVVAKKMGLDIKRVAEVFDLIKSLEPKPGREFYQTENIRYIIPDIIVRKINHKFDVIINEESVPTLNINSYYRKIVSEDINPEARKFIQGKIDSAVWLIKCIEQRKNTIRKVSECIVEKQAEFFEKGKKYLRPLTMKTVADTVSIHESTVSRTVGGKYMQCSWGTFEIRYFFIGKIAVSTGGEVSSENIKMKLKNLIQKEDRKHPLSDGEIADILKSEGFEISRRTVAKYRNELGIGTAAKRKQY